MGLPITMTSARLSWTCSQYQFGVLMMEVAKMIRRFRHSFTDSQVMMQTKLWSNYALNHSVPSILKLQLLSKGILFWRPGFPRFLKASVGHILWLHDISPFEKSSPIRNNFHIFPGHFCFVILNLIHSSISKLPGMTPKYVIVNHYHVSIQGGQWHCLSCVSPYVNCYAISYNIRNCIIINIRKSFN